MSTSTICKTKKTIVVSMSPIWSALKCLLLYSNPLVKTISYLMSSDPSHIFVTQNLSQLAPAR